MKKRVMKKMNRQFLAATLAVLLTVSGICLVKPEAKEVNASQAIQADTAVSEMLQIKMQANDVDTKGTESTEDDTIDLRIVSSVNGLGYANVGFEVWYGEAAKNPSSANITADFVAYSVLERIRAGVEYTFSPKVIDTSSEYFVTGTLKGIKCTNMDEDFYVRAFCTPLGGTKENRIYGVGRYFNVNDATAADIINIPMEMDELPTGIVVGDVNKNKLNVTITTGGETVGKETTAEVVAYLDGYAHLNVTVPTAADVTTTDVNAQVANKKNLASASKITVDETDDMAIYRNLESKIVGVTEYVPDGDLSWYSIDTTKDAYVIATAADMYGFMQQVNKSTGGTNFANKTVYLVNDIEMNQVTEGVANTWAQADAAGTALASMPYKWNTNTIAGNVNTHFSGVFDGQMHTISGVYMKEDAQYVGLFGMTAAGSVVKNFYLTESYFTTTYGKSATSNQPLSLGSVAGRSRGVIDGVYSSAIVQATQTYGRQIGGIVGWLEPTTTAEVTVNNCWFAGEVRANHDQVGGIVGYIHNQYNVTHITNSLFTGTITDSVSDTSDLFMVGGIVGANGASTAYIEDCVSTGIIQASSTVGSIMGKVQIASSVYHFINTYGTSETASSPLGGYEGSATIGNLGVAIEESNIQGTEAYKNTLLDFENTWCLIDSETPVLKAFDEKIKGTVITNLGDAKQNNWYNESVTKYGIHTLAALEGFRDYVNAGTTFGNKEIYLSDDIDMNPGWTAEINEETGKLVETPSYAWTPIGTKNNYALAGSFLGRNHTVSGLYIDNNTVAKKGLFGDLRATLVEDIKIVNSYITCGGVDKENAGALAGECYAKEVSNVYADAFLVYPSTGTGTTEIGGIIGRTAGSSAGLVQECWFSGEIRQYTTTGTYGVGGIIGRNIKSTPLLTISNCLNTGVNYRSQTGSQTLRMGGIIGATTNNDTAVNNITLTQCVNLGTLKTPNRTDGLGLGTLIGEIRGEATINANDSLWLKIDNGNSNYANKWYGRQIFGTTVTQTITDTTAVQYDDLATLLANVEGSEWLCLSVTGDTTGMNNVVQSDSTTGKQCLVLNDFKDWWLEYHNLTEVQ